MSILVTGGTGYIGSHTVIELLKNGEDVVVVDNLSNSKIEMCDKIKKLSGKDFKFYEVDLLERENLEKVFEENDIKEVIHFAALKAVGESCAKPIEYYHNNVTGTLILVDLMRKYGCKKIVFSSSATVYGDPETVPIKEDFPLSTTNPYGTTKLMIERILEDKENYISKENNDMAVPITQNETRDKINKAQVIYPIISDGDAIGSVILLSKDEKTKMSEVEQKVAQSAANFLGKQMEI